MPAVMPPDRANARAHVSRGVGRRKRSTKKRSSAVPGRPRFSKTRKPAAASPSVPVASNRSPGRAVDRRNTGPRTAQGGQRKREPGRPHRVAAHQFKTAPPGQGRKSPVKIIDVRHGRPRRQPRRQHAQNRFDVAHGRQVREIHGQCLVPQVRAARPAAAKMDALDQHIRRDRPGLPARAKERGVVPGPEPDGFSQTPVQPGKERRQQSPFPQGPDGLQFANSRRARRATAM
jgi:hypothetical protein